MKLNNEHTVLIGSEMVKIGKLSRKEGNLTKTFFRNIFIKVILTTNFLYLGIERCPDY